MICYTPTSNYILPQPPIGGFFLVKKKRSKAYFGSFLPLNPTIELKPTAIKPNTVEGPGVVIAV